MSINKLKLNGSVYDLDVLINGSSVSSVVSQLSSKFGDYTETSDLANVATSGSYNDLTDAPLTTAFVEIPLTYTYVEGTPEGQGYFYDITNQDGSVATFADGEEYQVITTINGNVYQYTATAESGQIQDPQGINNISYSYDQSNSMVQANVNGYIDNIGEYTADDVQIVIKKRGLVLNGVLPVSTFTNDAGYITTASIDTQITNAVSGKANTADLATVATTGSYSDLNNAPNLATVATTGSYNDLSDIPFTYNSAKKYLILGTIKGTNAYDNAFGLSVGDNGTMSGQRAILFGKNNGTGAAWGDVNIAIGSDNYVENYGTIAIGRLSKATKPYSIAIGSGANSGDAYGIATGIFPIEGTNSTTSRTPDQGGFFNEESYLFQVGNGKGDLKKTGADSSDSKRVRHNAFEIRRTGAIYIADVNNETGEVWQKPMIRLQDKLDELTTASSASAIASAVSSAAASAGYVTSSSLSTVATSGSYNDLTDKPTIPAAQIQADWNQTDTTAADYIKNKPTTPSLTGYATETWVSNKLNDILGIDASGVSSLVSILEDSDTTTGILNTIANKADKSSTVSNVAWDSTNAKLTKTINGTTSDIVTAATILGKLTSSQVISALGYTPSSSDSDTKNTTGSSNKTSTKMFLVGATSQATSPVTYSNSNCYIGSDNCLYSNGSKVITSHQNISGKVDKVTGKGLSTNDYTTTEKNKLDAISASVSGKVLTITTTA